MRKNALWLFIALAGCCVSVAYGDATLVYELAGPDVPKAEKTFSVARFWARVDDPVEKDRYLLFQAGKFFPMYRVDVGAETYTRLTPEVKPTLRAGGGKEPAAKGEQKPQSQIPPRPEAKADDQSARGDDKQPEQEKPAEQAAAVPEQAKMEAPEPVGAPPKTPDESDAPEKASAASTQAPAKPSEPPKFKPTKKMGTVAGMKCRVILELGESEEPIRQHCMANTGHLGLTEREVITLARLFAAAREMGFGWLGVGTKDERFISIETRDLTSNKTLQLKSISTTPLPKGHLRVSKSFKEVKSQPPKPADHK
jgi:hypothetical protein